MYAFNDHCALNHMKMYMNVILVEYYVQGESMEVIIGGHNAFCWYCSWVGSCWNFRRSVRMNEIEKKNPEVHN